MLPNEREDLEREDLDWLAFRYLADELDGDERDAFERRMAEDQSAREAVGRAVELTQALAAATEPATEAAHELQSRWQRAVLWMGIGAAACLALVLGIRALQVTDAPDRSEAGDGPIAVSPSAADESSVQLAITWSETRRRLIDEEAAVLWPADIVSDAAEPEELETPLASLETGGESTPVWMQAALMGLSQEDNDESSDEEAGDI